MDQPQFLNNYDEPVSIDLTPFQGTNIKLRFRGHNNGTDVLTFSWFIDNVKIVATDTTGVSVEEQHLNDVKIYPNPVKDRLYIESNSTIHYLSLIAANGVMLENKKQEGTVMELDLAGYAKGVYVLRLVTDDGVITKKVVLSE